MSIHVALHHVTHYRYDRQVNLGPQVLRLRPAPHCRSRILSYSLRICPEKHFINWQQDPQANYQARLVFLDTTNEFRIEVDLVAEMAVINPFDFFSSRTLSISHSSTSLGNKDELAPYFKRAAADTAFRALSRRLFRASRSAAIDFLVDLERGSCRATSNT